jgi:hypothetical protein
MDPSIEIKPAALRAFHVPGGAEHTHPRCAPCGDVITDTQPAAAARRPGMSLLFLNRPELAAHVPAIGEAILQVGPGAGTLRPRTPNGHSLAWYRQRVDAKDTICVRCTCGSSWRI